MKISKSVYCFFVAVFLLCSMCLVVCSGLVVASDDLVSRVEVCDFLNLSVVDCDGNFSVVSSNCSVGNVSVVSYDCSYGYCNDSVVINVSGFLTADNVSDFLTKKDVGNFVDGKGFAFKTNVIDKNQLGDYLKSGEFNGKWDLMLHDSLKPNASLRGELDAVVPENNNVWIIVVLVFVIIWLLVNSIMIWGLREE